MVVLFAKRANKCFRELECNAPPGHNVCFCINWYLPDLFSDFDSNVEQAVWIVMCGGVYSNARQPCLASASASVRWTFDPVSFGTFRWIIDFRFQPRIYVKCLVSRFSRQQANSTPEACVPVGPGCSRVCPDAEHSWFLWARKKYRSATPHRFI